MKDPAPQQCLDKLAAERYQAFIENIDDGVYEVDLRGHFTYFNQALCRVFGYPPEEILNENFSRFMPPEYAKKAFETFNRIYETGQGILDIVWETRDKGGGVRIIELSANLITDQQGAPVGFRGIARDITDKHKTQKVLAESEKRYRTLLDFVPYPIVVFTLEGRVSYLNPAFTDVFGWTLSELKGQFIPFVPSYLNHEKHESIQKLLKERRILRQETERYTKDGQTLNVVFRAAIFSESDGQPSGELFIMRDITEEKRIRRNNEAMLRISLALHEHPSLDDLLSCISSEVKSLLEAEGALVILLDREKNELYFKSGAHDDLAAEQRMKEVRYSAEKGVTGRIIRTGEPALVQDTARDGDFYGMVDQMVGMSTRNMLGVPMKSNDRIIGVLSAVNKKRGTFDERDIELLNMISGTVALSIENARFSEEIREAYKEVSSLNRAKDRVINHLSHELKTPMAVLGASINILSRRLDPAGMKQWKPTLDRAERNVNRILNMQYQVEDIMREKNYTAHGVLSLLLEECADEMEALVAEEVGEGPIVERIRKRIDQIFYPKEESSEWVLLNQLVEEILDEMAPHFAHRNVQILTSLEQESQVFFPRDVLKKVVRGLIRNAIENTPDLGKIQVMLHKRKGGLELKVHDFGIGITEENQRRIFEGFFVTQETMSYSSKKPFDFNAGGRGADLLRMRIFSERYGFRLSMESSRCRVIPLDSNLCPGDIGKCEQCNVPSDCFESGGTTFTVFFPEESERK